MSGTVERTIFEVLAIGAIIASGAAVTMARQGSAPAAVPLLIYDRAQIAEQIEPWVLDGQDPMAVIETAIDTATAQGFFVLDADANFRGPEGAAFRLSSFVAVPEAAPPQDTADVETLLSRLQSEDAP